MKRIFSLGMVILMLAALVVSGACAAPTVVETGAAEIAALEKEVAALEKEIVKLEAAAPVPAEVFEWDLYSTYTVKTLTSASWWWFYKYVDEVYNLTDGRIDITTYFMGEHPYKIFDGLKIIRDVSPEICELACAQVSGEDPRFGVTDLPLLFPPRADLYHKVLDEAIVPDYLTPIIAEYGYQPLITHCWSAQRIGGVGFVVTDWDSLKGKKIRIWNPQLADTITMLGGIPQSISWGEVYTSLATGLIDGVVTNSGAMVDNKFFEVLTSLTLSELQFGAYPYCVNKDALDALPADLSEKLLAWAEKTQPENRIAQDSYIDHATLKGLIGLGFEMAAPSPSFVDEVRDKCWEGVWEPWIERAGGPGTPAADAFNVVAKVLIDAGYTVPNYKPY